MGYQPMKSYLFVFDKFNTISGEVNVRANCLRDAEAVIKELGLFDLVSYQPEQRESRQLPPSKP